MSASTEVTKMATAGSSGGGSGGGGTAGGDKHIGLGDETAENSISIFSSDYKKNDDLKQMLDSNKDNLKLDAMKRIIGMIAKGKDASDLFPPVVKNVVSKNMEIKKLVYVYLMRYAEEQQDLALLSISTFQRALKDPNPLIRASALRVLSSIRVPIIVTIMLLAIKEAVNDMSPYVRKTAANAIAKLYNLDPEQKDELVEIIEKLLYDKTILVAGSAIHAFEVVCPERIDLIHKNFRKLCGLLVDVDEWGQVIIINMLTRYSRTQFTDPNLNVDDGEGNEASGGGSGGVVVGDGGGDDDDDDGKAYIIDPDHRLLLRSTRPLLQSRNSSVVMAVAQLYYYLAPRTEVEIVAKALIRLLRSYREVQIVVLKNIVTMTQNNKRIFEPYLKSFYVHSNDSIHIKLLKLEILTCLATESNISTILREFQAYVLSNDKEFAASTIHAIGRCASTISEVTDACLNGLVSLMSKKDETIVAESVVVIKRLLQLNPSKNSEIIKHMAKMTHKIAVPMARASILWLIGEYSDHVPKIAPDVLRQMAKTFCDEEDIVKLQILNLALKLNCTNHKSQTQLLVQYILNLAKYDQNYDIRDRARFLRALSTNNEKCPNLYKHAKKFLLATKPAPVLDSPYKDSDHLQLGSLSHAINLRINGYNDLPDFPQVATDPMVRNVEIPQVVEMSSSSRGSANVGGVSGKGGKGGKTSGVAKQKAFYSDEEDEEENGGQSTEGPDPSDDEEEGDKENESESSSGSASESESESSTEEDTKVKKAQKKSKPEDDDEDDESEGSSTEESDSEAESDSEEEKEPKKPQAKQTAQQSKKNVVKETSSSDSESSSSESKSESSSSSEDEKPKAATSKTNKPPIVKQKQQKQPQQQQVSLLDLDFNDPAPVTTTTTRPASNSVHNQFIDYLSPTLASDLKGLSDSKPNSGDVTDRRYEPKRQYELLSKLNGNGLQIKYQFTRNAVQPQKTTNVELLFSNQTNYDIESIQIVNKKLQAGMSMTEFKAVNGLLKTQNRNEVISIDFNDTTQQAQFEVEIRYQSDEQQRRVFNLSIGCPCGELLQQNFMSESEFNVIQGKLKGMNEVNAQVDVTKSVYTHHMHNNMKTLMDVANMCQISSASQHGLFKFASLTTSSKVPLLLTMKLSASQDGQYNCQITINCEKIVLANMFLKEVKQFLTATAI